MEEHKCEYCGHEWKAPSKASHCMACGNLNDIREDKENGKS